MTNFFSVTIIPTTKKTFSILTNLKGISQLANAIVRKQNNEVKKFAFHSKKTN